MRRAYPSLRLVSQPQDPELVWEGILHPIRVADEFDAILDDVEHDRPVLVVEGALPEIRHHPLCEIKHGDHRLVQSIVFPTRSFTVRVTDRGDGSLPQTIILEPPIHESLHKHFLRGGVCAFAPWKYDRDEGIVSFVDHSLIWVLKWNVFSQTEPHEWIGSETPHEPKYLLETLSPNDLCWCGAAKTFQNCCRSATAYAAFGKPWLQLELWLHQHNSNPKRLDRIINKIQGMRGTMSFAAAG